MTLKFVRDVAVNRNSLTTRQKRLHYVSNILDGTIDPRKSVFIDETGFNNNIRRSFGRSLKGSRCFKVCRAQRGKKLSVCMAISIDGVIHHKIKSGSFDRKAFQEFITELSVIVGDEELFFVMDNCKIHYETYPEHDEHVMTFLPPYSPMLYPIESVFNQLKAKIKLDMAEVNLNQQGQIRSKLIRCIEEWIFSHMCVKMTPFFNHCIEFYARCINKTYIYGDKLKSYHKKILDKTSNHKFLPPLIIQIIKSSTNASSLVYPFLTK